MAQTDMMKGLCPKCRKILEIPGQLTEFSCMYCGARLTPELLLPMAAPEQVDSAEAEDSLSYFRAHLVDPIANHQGIEKQMSKETFFPAFDAFQAANRRIFDQLDLAVRAGSITPDQAAAEFLDRLALRWDENSTKRTRNNMMETDKFILAIFMIPMVRKLQLSVSEPFCLSLHQQWMERYPKNPFQLGDFDTLAGGFNKKFLGLCFITTAVCRHDHKPDDCAELTAFRSFRDGYLRACPDGPDLIDEYYNVAPAIVIHIEMSQNRDAIYDSIRDQYLKPCFADIREGKLQQCKDRYVSMVRTLEHTYLS